MQGKGKCSYFIDNKIPIDIDAFLPKLIETRYGTFPQGLGLLLRSHPTVYCCFLQP